MPKYVIWDKQSDIYTHYGKKHWTADEYIEEKAPWAGQPGAKVIISGGTVNGAFFEDFHERVAFYRSQGVEITDTMTDRQILDAMEEYDLTPPAPTEEEQEAQAQLQAVVAFAREQVKGAADEEVLKYGDLYPTWKPAAQYAAGDLVNHGGKLYRVVQAHTSQAHQPPDGAGMLAIYTVVQLQAAPGQTLAWVAGEAVKVGDLRTYNGVTYRCRQGHTTLAGWEPPGVPSLWEKVG